MESVFKQLEYQLDEGPRWSILFGHRITSIVFVVKQKGDSKFRAISAKRLSCTEPPPPARVCS